MANEKKGLNISNAIKIGALITAVILIAFSANYIISTETTNTEQWNNFDSFENTEMKEKLNEKNLPEPIEKSFSEKGLPLSNPKISVEGHNEEWKIIGEDQTYLIKKEKVENLKINIESMEQIDRLVMKMSLVEQNMYTKYRLPNQPIQKQHLTRRRMK